MVTQDISSSTLQCRNLEKPSSRANFSAWARHFFVRAAKDWSLFCKSGGGPCSRKDDGGARSSSKSSRRVARDNITYSSNP